MNTSYLLGYIKGNMDSMDVNACLECNVCDICEEVNGETMCGILRLYYNG